MATDPGRRLEIRDDASSLSASLSARLRRLLDRFANAQIGPAAADVAGHRVVVAALNDLAVEPGLLDRGPRRCRADCLDRRDRGGADAVDRGDTGTGGDAVDVHGAGAA